VSFRVRQADRTVTDHGARITPDPPAGTMHEHLCGTTIIGRGHGVRLAPRCGRVVRTSTGRLAWRGTGRYTERGGGGALRKRRPADVPIVALRIPLVAGDLAHATDTGLLPGDRNGGRRKRAVKAIVTCSTTTPTRAWRIGPQLLTTSRTGATSCVRTAPASRRCRFGNGGRCTARRQGTIDCLLAS